ncbi:hypothetical protein GCM10010174_79280 [Kutzneria viridogrisea]|uniref:HTH araC/xylS-type domain-containing protein n=2 Tax=Kutzneria TaxID=43356 RepID=W5WAY9_9PSEU|nr:AraC family transcriptional regulator [Kutzneria albida]AHH98092.1 hypothetical protein KALB_4730 [Kutzneria albida DSM 43870]MBA8924225.1 AraC-like DNA-binding protein [Kutzneria viridogrisea]
MGIVFQSTHLDEMQEYLSAHYAPMRLKARLHDQLQFRLIRNPLGPISLDLVDCGFALDWAVNPPSYLGLVGAKSGTVSRGEVKGVLDRYGPGEVFLVAQPDRPYVVRVCHARYSFTMLEPALLSQVAGTAPGHIEAPVRLTSYRPISPAAGQQLLRTITFLRNHVATAPALRGAPLIASTATQLLAAMVLATFPHTALLDPTIEDRHDAHSATLRRAIAFIDDHAHHDISLADIAAATRVSIRALQYAFRRHRGTTPMGYLRLARLHHAHQELVAADPTTGTTVTEIAARWGFFHPGRFAYYYRRAYGQPPSRTLLGHAR